VERCLDAPRLKYDDLEKGAAEVVAKVLTDTAFVRKAGEDRLAGLEAEQRELEEGIGPVEAQLAEAEHKRQKLLRALADGLDETEYEARKARLDNDITGLRDRLAEHTDAHEALLLVRRMADDLRKALAAGNYAVSEDADVIRQVNSVWARKATKGTPESRSWLAAGLRAINGHIVVGRDGIYLETAILTTPLQVGVPDRGPSRRTVTRRRRYRMTPRPGAWPPARGLPGTH
jgi:hypothetical protein